MADIGTTYTDPKGALAEKIKTLTGQMATSVANKPVVRQDIANTTLQSEGLLNPLAETRGELINKLASADQNLAQRYGTPGTDTYIANPLARETASTALQQPVWGALANVNTLIGARTQVLQDAMERGSAIYEAGLKAKDLELQSLYKQYDLLDQQEKAKQEQANWEAEFGVKYGGGAKLSTQDQKDYDALDMLQTSIKQLDQASLNNAHGPIQGRINRALATVGQYDQYQSMDSINNFVASKLVNILYPGIPAGSAQANSQIQRIMKQLPNETDSEGQRRAKINALSNIATANAKNFYQRTGIAHNIIGGSGLASRRRNVDELPTDNTAYTPPPPMEGGTTIVEE